MHCNALADLRPTSSGLCISGAAPSCFSLQMGSTWQHSRGKLLYLPLLRLLSYNEQDSSPGNMGAETCHIPINMLLSVWQATGRQTVLSEDETFSTRQQDTTKHMGSAPFSTGNKALNFPILSIPTAARETMNGRPRRVIQMHWSSSLQWLQELPRKKAEQTVYFSLISSSD